jgi:hypothetical protein
MAHRIHNKAKLMILQLSLLLLFPCLNPRKPNPSYLHRLRFILNLSLSLSLDVSLRVR